MTILITGTSSGIGNALAKEYLRHGNHVYGLSRSPSHDLDDQPGFHFLRQDISRFHDLGVNLATFLQEVSHLDLVILNAGILPEIKDLGETGLEEIHRVMDINVWANKVILDTLFEPGRQVGQVIAISSGAAVKASRGWNAYALSKATLNMLIGLYAKERPGTHFTALAPGVINTGMQEYIRNLDGGDRFPVVRKLRELYEESRMSSPEEAAADLVWAIQKVRSVESGSYADIRDLGKH